MHISESIDDAEVSIGGNENSESLNVPVDGAGGELSPGNGANMVVQDDVCPERVVLMVVDKENVASNETENPCDNPIENPPKVVSPVRFVVEQMHMEKQERSNDVKNSRAMNQPSVSKKPAVERKKGRGLLKTTAIPVSPSPLIVESGTDGSKTKDLLNAASNNLPVPIADLVDEANKHHTPTAIKCSLSRPEVTEIQDTLRSCAQQVSSSATNQRQFVEILHRVAEEQEEKEMNDERRFHYLSQKIDKSFQKVVKHMDLQLNTMGKKLNFLGASIDQLSPQSGTNPPSEVTPIKLTPALSLDFASMCQASQKSGAQDLPGLQKVPPVSKYSFGEKVPQEPDANLKAFGNENMLDECGSSPPLRHLSSVEKFSNAKDGEFSQPFGVPTPLVPMNTKVPGGLQDLNAALLSDDRDGGMTGFILEGARTPPAVSHMENESVGAQRSAFSVQSGNPIKVAECVLSGNGQRSDGSGGGSEYDHSGHGSGDGPGDRDSDPRDPGGGDPGASGSAGGDSSGDDSNGNRENGDGRSQHGHNGCLEEDIEDEEEDIELDEEDIEDDEEYSKEDEEDIEDDKEDEEDIEEDEENIDGDEEDIKGTKEYMEYKDIVEQEKMGNDEERIGSDQQDHEEIVEGFDQELQNLAADSVIHDPSSEDPYWTVDVTSPKTTVFPDQGRQDVKRLLGNFVSEEFEDPEEEPKSREVMKRRRSSSIDCLQSPQSAQSVQMAIQFECAKNKKLIRSKGRYKAQNRKYLEEMGSVGTEMDAQRLALLKQSNAKLRKDIEGLKTQGKDLKAELSNDDDMAASSPDPKVSSASHRLTMGNRWVKEKIEGGLRRYSAAQMRASPSVVTECTLNVGKIVTKDEVKQDSTSEKQKAQAGYVDMDSSGKDMFSDSVDTFAEKTLPKMTKSKRMKPLERSVPLVKNFASEETRNLKSKRGKEHPSECKKIKIIDKKQVKPVLIQNRMTVPVQKGFHSERTILKKPRPKKWQLSTVEPVPEKTKYILKTPSPWKKKLSVKRRTTPRRNKLRLKNVVVPRPRKNISASMTESHMEERRCSDDGKPISDDGVVNLSTRETPVINPSAEDVQSHMFLRQNEDESWPIDDGPSLSTLKNMVAGFVPASADFDMIRMLEALKSDRNRLEDITMENLERGHISASLIECYQAQAGLSNLQIRALEKYQSSTSEFGPDLITQYCTPYKAAPAVCSDPNAWVELSKVLGTPKSKEPATMKVLTSTRYEVPVHFGGMAHLTYEEFDYCHYFSAPRILHFLRRLKGWPPEKKIWALVESVVKRGLDARKVGIFPEFNLQVMGKPTIRKAFEENPCVWVMVSSVMN